MGGHLPIQRLLFPLLGLTVALLATGCATLPEGKDGSNSSVALTTPDRLHEAELAAQEGRLDDAGRRYREILAVEPDQAEALLGLANVEMRLERWRDAEVLYARRLRLNDRDANALEGRGLSLMRLREPAEAKVMLERAVAVDPMRWRAWHALGLLADRAGTHAEAEAAYRKALEVMPAHPALMNSLGYSLILARRFDEAERVLREALRHAPDSPRLKGNLALSIAWQGRYEEALKLLRGDTDREAAMAYNDVGYVAMQRQDWPTAIRFFEKALDLSPTYYQRAADNLERARQQAREARPAP
ncbi:tetratricopeptide repeat protein [Thiofaba sp. EF100]|uniref:tetratricopeptide repeat protein n=1 Tax=Thiofaba sp. EF100 TaxID=3121274 RepID=UPI0032216335